MRIIQVTMLSNYVIINIIIQRNISINNLIIINVVIKNNTLIDNLIIVYATILYRRIQICITFSNFSICINVVSHVIHWFVVDEFVECDRKKWYDSHDRNDRFSIEQFFTIKKAIKIVKFANFFVTSIA